MTVTVYPSTIRMADSVYAVSSVILAARPRLGYGEMRNPLNRG